MLDGGNAGRAKRLDEGQRGRGAVEGQKIGGALISLLSCQAVCLCFYSPTATASHQHYCLLRPIQVLKLFYVAAMSTLTYLQDVCAVTPHAGSVDG